MSTVLRYHGFKVPIHEVESRLLDLPSVTEACIVSIPDKDATTRVAALVRLHQEFLDTNLATIRKHLSENLLYYKLPTALRLLRSGEEIPLTVSGKVIRRKVVENYFPLTEDCQLPAEVEVWDIRNEQTTLRKAWDWAGLQGC